MHGNLQPQPASSTPNDHNNDISAPPSSYSPRDYPRSFRRRCVARSFQHVCIRLRGALSLAHTTSRTDNRSRVASRRVNCLPQRRQGLLSHASSSPISCRLSGSSLVSYAPINSGAERGILLEPHGSGSGSSRDPSTLVVLISFIRAIVETLLPE
jgi:hypothetical protein